MIKINLALRRQAKFAVADGEGAAGGLKGFGSKIDFDALKAYPIVKIAITLVIYFGGHWALDQYKNDQLAAQDVILQQKVNEQQKLQAELAKTQGYEKDREQLEQNERVMRDKIDAIKRLSNNRQSMANSILNLSESIPKEAWVTEFSVQNPDVSVKGFAVDYDNVSDFMQKLGEGQYFAALELKTTNKTKDDKDHSVTEFEVGAKRREE